MAAWQGRFAAVCAIPYYNKCAARLLSLLEYGATKRFISSQPITVTTAAGESRLK